ncbi:hypothetical protein BH582_19480 [Vibrio sp. 10N.222.47.A9]|uniref:DUF2513 domain-containing protein n=1 Tax=Vibrio sp. 10N.222.47.A9 TaxID=1903178 RepID=UPI000979ECF9|nr:DUF2513 domain-containing protein [Vibrio sp. 10N.222.47.A9]OMO28299.1 hypothetical protein BH582_19480 [Vibrio sp. 10N.222.47.A9]
MDIDYAYIKQVLSEIKDAQEPYADSKKLYIKYLDVDDDSKKEFIFHWHLIVENGLVSTNKNPIYDLKSSGLVSSPQAPMKFMLVPPPIRLTSSGIEFLSSLEEPKVLDVIVNKFKGEGFSAIVDISKQLGMKVLSKKLESIDF